MRIMQPRTGFALVGAALLATGVTSMAVAAQNQAPAGPCYSTCPPRMKLDITPNVVHVGSEEVADFSVIVGAGLHRKRADTDRNRNGEVRVDHAVHDRAHTRRATGAALLRPARCPVVRLTRLRPTTTVTTTSARLIQRSASSKSPTSRPATDGARATGLQDGRHHEGRPSCRPLFRSQHLVRLPCRPRCCFRL